MKIRFSKELFVLLAVVILLLVSAAVTFLIPPGWFRAVTFDTEVMEDTVLLVDEKSDSFLIQLEDGEVCRVPVSSHTKVTDGDGRKLDLTEGVELKAGQPIRITVDNLVYYSVETNFSGCFKIVLLSP